MQSSYQLFGDHQKKFDFQNKCSISILGISIKGWIFTKWLSRPSHRFWWNFLWMTLDLKNQVMQKISKIGLGVFTGKTMKFSNTCFWICSKSKGFYQDLIPGWEGLMWKCFWRTRWICLANPEFLKFTRSEGKFTKFENN